MPVLASWSLEADAAEMLVRLLLAVVLGGIIGLDRQFHGRPAGLRTHMMVCLAATMVMLAAGYLSRLDPEFSEIRLDPARMAAGVLTGMGFIGAGAILRLKNTHRGLTTAACVWFVAALGVVVGMGCYSIAIAGTLLAVFVLLVLRWVERAIRPNLHREVAVVFADVDDALPRARAAVEALGMHVASYDFTHDVASGELRITLDVKFRRHGLGEKLLASFRDLPGVRSVAWLPPES